MWYTFWIVEQAYIPNDYSFYTKDVYVLRHYYSSIVQRHRDDTQEYEYADVANE